MAETEQQSTPLIDPEKVKAIIQPEVVKPAEVVPGVSRKKQPTAEELGPKEYCWGLGRRKRSVARVRVRPGKGEITINNRKLNDYFPNPQDQKEAQLPLTVLEQPNQLDIFVKVHGGGTTGQAGAMKLGLARALLAAVPSTFGRQRDAGFFTRDSRMVERKKYGQKGARKRFQFSKR